MLLGVKVETKESLASFATSLIHTPGLECNHPFWRLQKFLLRANFTEIE
jgi:hypothetical protein